MRRALPCILTAVLAAGVLVGCGGSDAPETVNGCVIEPAAQCPNADLSGADLEGADLTRASLTGANLEGTILANANLSEANLSSAQIVEANLSDADLTRTNLTGATIVGTNLEGAILCGTIRTDGTIDDTGCAATGETTETATSDAEVTSFEVGDLVCGAATTAGVTVSWETENATAVEIAVGGFTPAGLGPSGSTTLTVPCDSRSHVVTITPRNDAGSGQPKYEEVSPS